VTARFLHVFAVEDTTVQLSWIGLPARQMIIGVGSRSVEVEAQPPAWRHYGRRSARPMTTWPAGPGAVVIDGLEPATKYPVWMREPGRARLAAGHVTTLSPPPGQLLSRFATVSDLHIGERRFGAFGAILDKASPEAEPYPLRCARAALDEARAWGATTVVFKGDITDRARRSEMADAAALIAGCGMDPLIQMGNHDMNSAIDRSGFGPDEVVSRDGRILVADRPGVRLVLGDTPLPQHRDGHIGTDQLDAIIAAVAGADGPAIVTIHHPPRRWPIAMYYPPGLRRDDSRRLLTGIREVNPATLVLAGHSHRNRTYRIDGTLIAEVGSTKDYPGGWAGYAVHEGGIRQVVRRTARPDVIAWTQATSAALGGIWGRWSPGTLADRCWTHRWPAVLTE
jgi:3',5'-cyclic-AMP phosphodiesterase